MRAVNLIPSEARRGGSTSLSSAIPTYLLLGILAIGVAFVTLYVLTSNTISQHRAKLTTIQSELAQAQAQSERLANYAQFEALAQSRTGTVRGLAQNRFDWHAALGDLAKVVPANTSLQSLNGSTTGSTSPGTAAPTTSATGSSAPPAFDLVGCTKSQDDVARLMSRLRLINGVTNVTLSTSQKPGTSSSGGASTPTPAPVAGTAGTAGQTTGCGANAPTFDIKVTFQPLPGTPSTATGTGSASSSTAASSTSGSSK